MSTKRYPTITDVISQVVIPALGDNADDFDHAAIASEISDYRVDTRTLPSGETAEDLNTAGFEITADTDEFWAIAQKHELPYLKAVDELTDGWVLADIPGKAQFNVYAIGHLCKEHMPEVTAVDFPDSWKVCVLPRTDGKRLSFGLEYNEDGNAAGWTYSVYPDAKLAEEASTGGCSFNGMTERQAALAILGDVHSWAQGA